MNILDDLKAYKEYSGKSWYLIAKEMGLPEQTVNYWHKRGKRPLPPYQKMIEKYIRSNSVNLKE